MSENPASVGKFKFGTVRVSGDLYNVWIFPLTLCVRCGGQGEIPALFKEEPLPCKECGGKGTIEQPRSMLVPKLDLNSKHNK